MEDFDFGGFYDGQDTLDDGFDREELEGFSDFDPDNQNQDDEEEQERRRKLRRKLKRRKAQRRKAA